MQDGLALYSIQRETETATSTIKSSAPTYISSDPDHSSLIVPITVAFVVFLKTHLWPACSDFEATSGQRRPETDPNDQGSRVSRPPSPLSYLRPLTGLLCSAFTDLIPPFLPDCEFLYAQYCHNPQIEYNAMNI